MAYAQFNGWTIIPMPTSPAPKQLDFEIADAVSMSQSPFTLGTQFQAWPGAEQWSCNVSLPAMSRAKSDAWVAWFMSLNGILNTFQMGDSSHSVPTGTLGGGNLVNNSGMELGIGTWAILYGNGASVTLDSVVKYQGSNSLKITWAAATAGTFGACNVSSPIQGGWKPNTTYVYSFWALGTGGAVGKVPYFGWNTTPATTTWITQPTLTTSWQRYVAKITFGASAEGGGHIYITMPSCASAGTMNIDCVQVTEDDVVYDYTVQPMIDGTSGGYNLPCSYFLHTKGWIASQTNLLLPGDLIQIGYRLHKVLAEVNSDASGNAVLSIWPSVREQPVDSQTIITTNTQGLWRLSDNKRVWTERPTKLVGLSFKIVEAR